MIASGTYHGATANKIRPIMIPAIAHLAWGVIDDSIHPGWDAAPRRLRGTPADARCPSQEERPAGLSDSTLAPPGSPGHHADANLAVASFRSPRPGEGS